MSTMAFAIFEPIQVLPRYHNAPGFAFHDQNEERFSSEDARGHIAVYTFGYAACGDACLATEATMREVRSRMGELDFGEDVELRLVTITIDPENDDFEVLRSEAERVGADGVEWRLVTGEPRHVRTVLRSGFEFWHEQEDDGSFTFDPKFVIVDKRGIVRGEYRFPTLVSDADKLMRHLGLLGGEMRHSHGAGMFAFEAAHLFLCYP